MAAKLKQIVLEFDDGSKRVVEDGYTAVYRNAGRAKKANEREPWKQPPGQSGGQEEAAAADRGKDDSSAGQNTGTGCYIINDVIVCP